MNKLMLAALVAASLTVAPKAHAATLFTMSPSTPAAQGIVLATGTGLLSAVEISSGSAGDFCVLYDSAAAPTNISASDTITAKRLGTIIVPATNTAYALPANVARPFVNGVSILCSAARNLVILISQ